MTARGLFPGLLGERWEALPEPVRRAHAGTGTVVLAGKARAFGSRGLTGLVRGLQGLPAPGPHDTIVTITSERDGERWSRRFGPRRFASTLVRAKDDPTAFEETIRPFTFRFALTARSDGFAFAFRRWRLGPIPLPGAWAPRIRSRSYARGDGAYRFRILVVHPWLGVIFGYAGRLTSPSPTSDVA
jgi:hypothetical protein